MCSRPSSSSCQKPAAAQFSTAKLAPSAIRSSSLPKSRCSSSQKCSVVGPPVPALAQVVEAQPERLADGQQPLEVGGAEPEQAAVDRPLGAHQVGVALAVLGFVVDRRRARRASPLVPPVDHPQLVHQDFLGRPRLLQRRGVDHPQQGRHQELVREHRELPDEVDELGVRRLPRRGTIACRRCR